MALWRVEADGTARWAAGPVDEGPRVLLSHTTRLDDLLAGDAAAVSRAARESEGVDGVPAQARVLVPLESQPVWAAGVTFERSREARQEESDGSDVYDRVYDAERPELFPKAFAGKVRGPGEPIGIRSDSSWDVPEPELTLIINAEGEIVAYTVGNDVSSRSVEGANPLYLPQAKIYAGSSAMGPCLVAIDEAPTPADMTIELRIERAGRRLFAESTSVASMHRSLEELTEWLMRGDRFPHGVALMTGTSIVPGPEFTLLEGDQVSIEIRGLGTLRNSVERIDSGLPPVEEQGRAVVRG